MKITIRSFDRGYSPLHLSRRLIQCCLAVWMFSVGDLNAQTEGVSISSTNTPPDGSAMLDVNSTSKGVLIPRLSSAQRDEIEDPAFGLMIMNTTTGCMNIWFGTSWKQVCGDCDFSNPVPGNNGPLCEGETLNLSATTIEGAVYSWTGPGGYTSSEQNPSIANVTTTSSGTYSVVATLNGCSTAPQGTVVTISGTPDSPTASASNDGIACSGENVNLMASTVSGAMYSWTGPNGFSANTQNTSLTNIQVSQSGTYSVTASQNGCSSAPGNTSVTVTAPPSTPGIISGSSTVLQNSTGNVYSIDPVAGADTYNWSVPSGATITSESPELSTSITVTFGTSSGNVSVSATNECGTSSVNAKEITVAPFASGGTVTESGGYKYHTFTTSGVFSVNVTGNVEVLVVAGGGGGSSGSSQGSGGGGGGLWYNTSYSVIPGSYTVTVGEGGLGSTTTTPTKGGNSQFGTLIADGGGAGTTPGDPTNLNGGCGGSPYNGSIGVDKGVATKPPLQGGGYDGAVFNSSSGGGGGGGTAGPGSIGQSTIGGNGGPGTLIWGNYYGGGGGGGAGSGTVGVGGIGGGGTGAFTGSNGTNGAANTGGGGGGTGGTGSGGNGGSGIVIIRYPI